MGTPHVVAEQRILQTTGALLEWRAPFSTVHVWTEIVAVPLTKHLVQDMGMFSIERNM